MYLYKATISSIDYKRKQYCTFPSLRDGSFGPFSHAVVILTILVLRLINGDFKGLKLQIIVLSLYLINISTCAMQM